MEMTQENSQVIKTSEVNVGSTYESQDGPVEVQFIIDNKNGILGLGLANGRISWMGRSSYVRVWGN